MPDNLNDDTPWRQGEHYDETMSEEPFHEEELDTEEAEQRITQFIMSAEKLPGPLVEELAERVTALMHVAGPASSRIAAARPRTVAPARGKHATEWDRSQRRSELKKYKIAHTYSRSQHVVLTTRSKALRSASLSEQLPDGMLAGEGETIRWSEDACSYTLVMADEDTVLEETMDDLKEAGGRIKELARSHQPSQLLVYKQNGTVQTEQTYG